LVEEEDTTGGGSIL